MRRNSYRLKPALAAIGLTIAFAPAEAIQIDGAILRSAGWKAANEKPPADTPCNYLYTDQSGKLLYYGTSKTCASRLNAHFALTRSGHEMIVAAVGFTAEAQKVPFQNSMTEWVNATEKGVSLYHGGSDNCLGVNQAKSKLQIWYIDLPDGADAALVEGKVLAKAVGYCNRQGAGLTSGSMDNFQTVLREAGARP